MLDFGDSVFPRGMIQPFPANAEGFSNGSRTGMAKNRRAQIVLSEEYRRRLERIRTSPQSTAKQIKRADIILNLGDGPALSQTMRATGMSKPTVRRRRDRFLEQGVDGLLRNIPGKTGRKPVSVEKAGGDDRAGDAAAA